MLKRERAQLDRDEQHARRRIRERELARNQCLPDRLQPHDIARMVLFLASDDAAMCTAQEFKVDAGWC